MADEEDIAALVVDNGSGMCKGKPQSIRFASNAIASFLRTVFGWLAGWLAVGAAKKFMEEEMALKASCRPIITSAWSLPSLKHFLAVENRRKAKKTLATARVIHVTCATFKHSQW